MNKIIANLFGMGFLLLAGAVAAYQKDAPQLVLEERYGEIWEKDDRNIDEKLARQRDDFGPPNIIFILSDDVGWGELGSYGGGKLRGVPTPNLDDLAADGMRFLQHYSEPLCTPSRVALMTGRHPIRTGLTDIVLWPGSRAGLAADEVTLAEVLSDAGYQTAMFGKWHLGENAENLPTEQGFDYAYYTLYNGAPWPWMDLAQHFDAANEEISEAPFYMDVPADYEERYGIELLGIQEARKGEEPREVAKLSLKRYNRHDNELTDGILDYIDQQSGDEKPFFVYFATNAQQIFACPPDERHEKYVDSGNCQAAQLVQHDKNVKRIREKLENLSIADNTLVIWASDNGPGYRHFPSVGFSYLRGSKGTVFEGGVRTPAIAWWPGMIAPGSDPMDLVHLTDWYTTISRIAGASRHIPDDRVLDGVDQTSLLFNGEGHSRRDYVFHYFGENIQAIRFGNIKRHMNGGTYNIIRDPAERLTGKETRYYSWTLQPVTDMIRAHKDVMKKYPNRAPSR